MKLRLCIILGITTLLAALASTFVWRHKKKYGLGGS